jgi:hypothetical protein
MCAADFGFDAAGEKVHLWICVRQATWILVLCNLPCVFLARDKGKAT